MNRTLATIAILIAGFAAACFLSTKVAPAQEIRGWNNGAAGPQFSGSVANAQMTNQAGEAGGSASWTAGKGSFGSVDADAWNPGTESFGSTNQTGGIWRDQSVSGPVTSPGPRATPTKVPAVNARPVHPALSLETLSSPRALASGKAQSHYSPFADQRHGIMAGGRNNLRTEAGAQSRSRSHSQRMAKAGTKPFSSFGSGMKGKTISKSPANTSGGESLYSDPLRDLETTPQ